MLQPGWLFQGEAFGPAVWASTWVWLCRVEAAGTPGVDTPLCGLVSCHLHKNSDNLSFYWSLREGEKKAGSSAHCRVTGWPSGDPRSGGCPLGSGCTRSSCIAGSGLYNFQEQCVPLPQSRQGVRGQSSVPATAGRAANGREIVVGRVIWGPLPDCTCLIGPHPS